ncbi:MAG: ABC transporter permease [Lachnospiraceae bacterium]|nr:ABC transporter permease [Lachnospiraceae bacterium]
MKNPLNKRFPKELLGDLGKYIVIFVFVTAMIAAVSGFFASDDNMYQTYTSGFETYHIESGHFSTYTELDEETIEQIEAEEFSYKDQVYQMEICNADYYNMESEGTDGDNTVRVYQNRESQNLLDIFEGEYASKEDEITLDRMYAANNDIKVGDTIKVGSLSYTVTGLVAAPDYSCLFEDNTSVMFDAFHFGVGFMSEGGINRLPQEKITYNYSWRYSTWIEDDKIAKEVGDEVLEYLKDTVVLTNFVPEYSNNAIIFTGDDMGSDKAMFGVFYVIVMVIIAFIFAVSSVGTIEKEAGVIGTLRASGYRKAELVRHYLFLPTAVIVLAGIIGNILGYTVFEDIFAELYYNSYSLAPYQRSFHWPSFLMTTLLPVAMMLVINLVVLNSKLKLSPLRFLRHDLSRRGRKKSIYLPKKRPFMHRFRLRILFQNIGNYIVLVLGVILAGVIVIFGLMFEPMLDSYGELVADDAIASHQYVLKTPAETETKGAEKYGMYSLNLHMEGYVEDSVLIYGIQEDSEYLDLDFSEHQIYYSNGLADKYKIKAGDTLKLDEAYVDKSYEFVLSEEVEYYPSFAIFMSIDDFNEFFDYEKDSFTGYFSNKEITDIDSIYISTDITVSDLTHLSDQLDHSIGGFVKIFQILGVVMFLLLMYLLSKQIIEKNAKSISMVKILGYRNGEVARLYIIATAVVVLGALLVAIPIVSTLLHWVFDTYIYTMMAGYIPYLIPTAVYVKMFVMGVGSYAVVSVVLMHKINRIPKSDALKNME